MKINYTSGQVRQFVFGDFMRYWVAEKDIFWAIGFYNAICFAGMELEPRKLQATLKVVAEFEIL